MKFSKIIVLILAIACMASLLASCDLDGSDIKSPETPKEHYEYACNYMMTHAYKETTVTTTTAYGVSSTEESVSYMDGENYYFEEDGMKTTYYDGTVYVETETSKKKMKIDILDLADLGLGTDTWNSLNDSLTDDNIVLTKNADGTKTLEFSLSILSLGESKYVFTLDAENRVVKYTMKNETAIMGYTSSDEVTIEYGDQYKVSPPADSDSFEEVSNFLSLVG